MTFSTPPRILLVGPIPPPINGQSIVMKHMVEKVSSLGMAVRVRDVSGGLAPRLVRPITKIFQSAHACISALQSDAAYIAVKGSKGMWLTTAVVAACRVVGAKTFLHHHSYAYVREKKFRMQALAWVAGANATHIVLSEGMSRDICATMPQLEGARIFVSNPAWVIDPQISKLPLSPQVKEIVLGHLSNLSTEKGIAEVVSLAIALKDAGHPKKLIVAGPTSDELSVVWLEYARRELGDYFEYRGPLLGRRKVEFFRQITHFVFPTQYPDEAVPAVLYEAMAAGAVCLTTARGGIREQLAASPCVIADSAETFVEQTLTSLLHSASTPEVSRQARAAYAQALHKSHKQVDDLLLLIDSSGRRPTVLSRIKADGRPRMSGAKTPRFRRRPSNN